MTAGLLILAFALGQGTGETSNMSLQTSTPGVTPNLTIQNNEQQNYQIIDQHNHTAGHGVQIPPAGLNINTTLPFQGNPAAQLGYANFVDAGIGPSIPLTLWTDGVNLWYEDGNGNKIELTGNGSGGSGCGDGGTCVAFNFLSTPDGGCFILANNFQLCSIDGYAVIRDANGGVIAQFSEFAGSSSQGFVSAPNGMCTDYPADQACIQPTWDAGIETTGLLTTQGEITNGGLQLVQVSLSAPSVTPIGTTGSTSYTYGYTCTTQSGESIPSPTTTIANGNATLSSGNSNQILINTALAQCQSYGVYLIATTGSASTGRICSVGQGTSPLLCDDTGQLRGSLAPTVDHSACVEFPDGQLICGQADGGLDVVKKSSQALTYYVGNNGNDANACTVSSAPCWSIQGAVNKIPKVIRNPVVVSVAAGVYDGGGGYVTGFTMDPDTQVVFYDAGPSLVIRGALSTASSLGGEMTGTITSSTWAGQGILSFPSSNVAPATATVSSAGWTINALAGYLFCITSGPGSGSCSPVQSNTATVATILGGWTGAAPNSSSTFAIKTWATKVTGTLPKPPGGTGLGLSYSSTFGASFYLQGNSAGGFRSGYGAGFGDDLTGSDAGIFNNTSFTDPQISIENIDFVLNDNSTAISAAGPQLAAVQNCRVGNGYTGGIGVWQTGGAATYVIGNVNYGDSFGDPFVYAQGYYGQGQAPGSDGFLALIGNYMIEEDSGGYNTLANTGIPTLSFGNYVAGVDGGALGELGIAYGGDAKITSVGDVFAFNQGININSNSAGGIITIDGLSCSGNSYCVQTAGGTYIQLVDNPITGGNNSVLLSISRSGKVRIGTASVPTATATAQIQLDTQDYSFTTLQAANPEEIFSFAEGGSSIWIGN